VTTHANVRWGSDATLAKHDGWVRVLVLIHHYTAGPWVHVAKIGNRFA
jgi:hypothetical protein